MSELLLEMALKVIPRNQKRVFEDYKFNPKNVH